MKKIFTVLVIISMILTFTACNNNPPKKTSKDFLGGEEGVVPLFIQGSPPETVRAGGDDPFSVVVRLDNRGEAEVPKEKVVVSLTGFDPYEFGTTPEALSKHPDEDLIANKLDPDTKAKIPSSPVEVAFDLNYVKQIQGANHEFPIDANICYSYTTLANAELCIKKKLTDTTDKKVCEVIGPKVISHSGGPVFAAEFSEASAGKNSVRFTFKVKQTTTNTGTVYKINSVCNHNMSDENKVWVKVSTGIPGLSCPGLTDQNLDRSVASGTIKLIEGIKDLSCTQTLTTQYLRDQIKIINIEMKYDYFDYATKKVNVLQTPQ
ncbi:MAG: hypothetical protein QXG00_02875 [Candidatus Woesearchaeota archaeon]